MDWIDRNAPDRGTTRIRTDPSNRLEPGSTAVLSYGDYFEEYRLHPEAKMLGPRRETLPPLDTWPAPAAPRPAHKARKDRQAKQPARRNPPAPRTRRAVPRRVPRAAHLPRLRSRGQRAAEMVLGGVSKALQSQQGPQSEMKTHVGAQAGAGRPDEVGRRRSGAPGLRGPARRVRQELRERLALRAVRAVRGRA